MPATSETGAMRRVSWVPPPASSSRGFADRYEQGQDWRSLAWWIHDHLPNSALFFFPRLAAFNITWHENPERRISSYIKPRGILTRPGMDNHDEDHSAFYEGFPALRQS